MRAFLLIFLHLVLLFPSVQAAEPVKQVRLYGNVRDSFSKVYLSDVLVEVLSAADSSVVAVDSCRDWSARYPASIRDEFRAGALPQQYVQYRIPVRPGKFLLRFTRQGYQPLVMPLDINTKRYGRDVTDWQAEDAFMQRSMEGKLGEAVVRATKIMMVNKGDTVVFNADYFQLAYGNMLDKLVEMLPGLEIKAGGQIFYNGSHLSNLLVNGRDFFKGDATMALQNLPAYMVKNLKIYHRKSEREALEVHKDASHQSPNTLDVILKKAYSHGWITNYELAGGPALGKGGWEHSKYLARLFALHYNDNSHLGIIGNFNNVSNLQEAGKDGAWKSPEEARNGVTELLYGGLTFNRQSPRNSTKHDLSLKVSREKNTLETRTSGTSFLPAGDVFKRMADDGKETASSMKLRYYMMWGTKKIWLCTPFDFEMGRTKGRESQLSAQFSQLPHEAYRGASLDSLFVGPQSPHLAEILTNSMERHALRENRRLRVNYRMPVDFRSPWSGNKIGIEGEVGHSRQAGERYERFLLQMPQAAGEGDFRNRYFDTSGHSTLANIHANYSFNNMMSATLAKHLSAVIFYFYDHSDKKERRSIFNLHTLDGISQDMPLGSLPSADNWRLLCMDTRNSFLQHERTDNHQISTQFLVNSNHLGQILFVPKVETRHTSFSDSRSPQRVDRHDAYFGTFAEYFYRRSQEYGNGDKVSHELRLQYNLGHTPPSSLYLLDIHDDSQPLWQTLGNSALRSPAEHTLNTYYRYDMNRRILEISGSFRKTDNAIAMGYSYDSQTGVYTYRPENVDGNWTSSLSARYTQPFGSQKRWNVSSETVWDYQHSVDIVNSLLSTVRNHGLREKASLFWNMGDRGRISLHATAQWQVADSEREDYRRRNTWDLQYGPDISLKLPHDLHFSTDFSICQRRGYDDRSMNDTELIWNASLNWDFDFRRSSYYRYEMEEGFEHKVAGTGARPWTLRITCHDLLRQLSNTRRVLNAQGITETWYNNVPAYVMLHLCYRFSKVPKK